ncbi:MAG: hypothetical protein AMS27_14525 [Bacteroides sp. SM23_62_1]|nr:MAG: hypothetical protein AMS27_14525 [Bacteroides sp. SM23_62_1]
MKTCIYLLSFLLIITIPNCEKESSETIIKCSELLSAFQSNDTLKIKSEIDTYLSELIPEPSLTDIEGHIENTVQLVKEINKCSGIKAELVCYACIYTYPSQSEIRVCFKNNGTETIRIMDILNSEKMKFIRIHE